MLDLGVHLQKLSLQMYTSITTVLALHSSSLIVIVVVVRLSKATGAYSSLHQVGVFFNDLLDSHDRLCF